MHIVEERIGGSTVLMIVGRLDSGSSPDAEAKLMAFVGAGPLVIDLSQTSYVSSAGLRLFLKAAKAAKAGGHALALAALPAPVQEIFEISGFTSLFRIYASPTDAAAA